MAKKLAIAIPLNLPTVYSTFFLSVTQMLLYSQGEFEPHVYVSNACLIDRMREVLAEEVLAIEPDYILWLDADQVYPMDTIFKLAKHVDEGKLVVGGVTPDKLTGNPMVYRIVNEIGTTFKVKGFELNRGVVPVDAMGFGGIMTHPSVFKEIGPPFFQRNWDEDLMTLVGEDFSFYARCKNKGIQVWCDTDLHYSHMVAQVVNVNRSPKCQSLETAREFGEKENIKQVTPDAFQT